jgi:hypothetical protein
VRQQIVEDAGVRDRHHSLARRQRELLDDAFRHSGVVERQARLRRESGRADQCEGGDDEEWSHGLLIYQFTTYQSPTHELTNSPIPQFTNPPTHQLVVR